MSDSIRKAKDRGAELLAKGKLKAALEQYLQVASAAPKEIGARQKVAEILVKLGRSKEAVPHYEAACDAYAYSGHFFKAIALCRVILSIAPGHSSAQDNLTRLYGAARQPTPKTGNVAEPMSAQAIKPAVEPTRESPTAAAVDEPIELGDEDLIEVEVADTAGFDAAPPAGGGVLPAIPLFSELSPDEFKAVLNGAVEACVFSDGQAIVTEGELGSSMYALCEGEVSVMRPSSTGDREVARMKEGEIFGELGLVFGSPRLATVVARGEVIALEFQRSAMEAVFRTHPGVERALERFYRERLLANVLRASPAFGPLPAETKTELAGQFELSIIQPGTVLIAQHAPSDGLYLLLRGTCEVSDASGARYPDLREGAHFGEISILLNKPATATVRAATSATVLKLPAGVFKEKVLSNAAVKELLVTTARERLERTTEVLMRGLNVELV